MSAQPPGAKPLTTAPKSSRPLTWNAVAAESATTNWEDTIPVAQQSKAKSGLQGQLLLVGEVATVLRCTDATVRKYLRDGAMLGHRVGGKWRVFEADLDAFLFKTMIDIPCSTPGAAGALTLLAPISAIGPKSTPAKHPYFLDPTQV